MKLIDAFKALGDENRLKIIKMLACYDMCVCDICNNLELSQPAVSHHLKILSDSELLITKRQGKWIYYSINQDAFNLVKGGLDEIFLKPNDCSHYVKTDCADEE